MKKLLLTIVGLVWFSQLVLATTCPNAEIIPATPTFPYTQSLVCGATNDITALNSTVCGSDFYYGGNESVYVWTPSLDYEGGSIEYNGVAWTSITVYAGCPTSGGTCVGNISSSTSSKTLSGLTFTAGVTYYFVFDIWPTPVSPCPGTFIFNAIVYIPPSCPEVTGIMTNSLTTNSAEIGWNAGGSESAWNVEYGPTGYTPGTGTAITPSIVDTFAIASGLTPSTSYDFYVQANCGVDSSLLTGPYTVYTGYCIPSTSNTGDYISSFSTSAAVQNVTYSATSQAPGSYSDNSSEIISSFPSGSFDFSTTYVGGTNGVSIWVDWNNNLTFEPSELVHASQSNSATTTGTINIPLSVSAGNYRFRIRSQFGFSINPPACGSVSYGSTIDYTLNLTAAPSCLPVTALVVSSVSDSEMNVTWTAGGTEANWIVEWGLAGYTPGNEIGTANSATNSFLINSLLGNTEYDVYVAADCVADTSFTTMVNATTLCSPILAQGYCESFESANALDCWTVLNENGGADMWNIQTSSSYANTGSKSVQMFTDLNSGNNDDWLILPKMTLTGNEILNFHYRVRSSSEPNDFRVVLSTTGLNPTDFTQTLMALDTYTNTSYKDTNVNLSAYSGDVYIAFHIPPGGLDGYYLYIDDICIDICTPAAGTDGAMNVCRFDDSVDLNTVITQGESNGVWNFTPNQAFITGSTFNYSTIPDGTYDLQYIVTTACTVDTTVATLTIYPPSEAGADGQIDVCQNQPFNLLSGLSGLVNLGGTWYNSSNDALVSGQITSGTTTGLSNYSYVVGNGVCPADTSIIIVNVSATCDYSGVNELILDGINIYPNPSNGIFYISNSTAGQTFNYEVLDLNGRVVIETPKEINGTATVELDLTAVENGTYMIRLFNENGSKLLRIVKQ